MEFLFSIGVHELPKTDYADDASSDSRSSSGQSISPVRCWPAMAGLPAIINNNNNNNTNNNNNNNKTSSLRSSSYDPKVILPNNSAEYEYRIVYSSLNYYDAMVIYIKIATYIIHDDDAIVHYS